MIRHLDDVTEFPLCWPPGKDRVATRLDTPFQTSMAKAQSEISYELPRWGVRGYVVSMAPQHCQGAIDPGVALWWDMPPRTKGGPFEMRVLASDRYKLREANLHAIALTLERLRSMERYGTYSLWQAIEGARAALPPPQGPAGPPWWEVLGVGRDWPLAAIEKIWKADMANSHPDRGGSTDGVARLNNAIAEARKEKLG